MAAGLKISVNICVNAMILSLGVCFRQTLITYGCYILSGNQNQ